MFPRFPAKVESTKIDVREKITVNVTLYKHKDDKKKFAVKLDLSINAVKKGTKRTVFRFESSVVGIFIKGDSSIPSKIIAKKEAKNILYEKVRFHFDQILKNSAVKEYEIPLKLK
ncbi:MAG: hypothetical protein ACYC09_14775 [Bacteroidota bacterium]